jgi:7,8-dihydroneopterin aldolase/epimerase/oxygenase
MTTTQPTRSAPSGQRPADRLCLRGLRAHAHHGVLEHERRDGQEFVVDVEIGLDTRAAASGDDLSATVHYGELAERLHAALVGEPVDLIETLAERLADVCLAEQPVAWVQVTVHKPDAPISVAFDDVSLTIHRSRDD